MQGVAAEDADPRHAHCRRHEDRAQRELADGAASIDLALREDRIHALVIGYWHTIITPPMVFAELLGEAVEAARAAGNDKPVVASLVGDVEIEDACDYLMERNILAYPYTAEKPVAVLGAKYRWARAAGLL